MKAFPLGKTKFLKRAEGSGSSGSDAGTIRNKMGVLKSDVILLQTEIDAVTGEAGILETQCRIEKLSWCPDPEACNRNLEALYSLVIQKINELVRVCTNSHNSSTGSGHVPHAYPADSRVGDVIHYFHRNVHAVAAALPQPQGAHVHAIEASVPASSRVSAVGVPPAVHSSPAMDVRSVANSTASQLVDDPDGVSWTAGPVRRGVSIRGQQSGRFVDGPVVPGLSAAESLSEIPVQPEVFDLPRTTGSVCSTIPPSVGQLPHAASELKHIPSRVSEEGDGIQDDDVSATSDNQPSSELIASLRHEVQTLKSKLNFFRSLDKHLSRVPDAIDTTHNLSVKNTTFEGLAANAKALLSSFPFLGRDPPSTPPAATPAPLQASPGKPSMSALPRKGTGATLDNKSFSEPPPIGEEKQKLLYCIAFQNAFIDMILSQQGDKLRLAASQELADAHQRIEGLEKLLRSQADQSAKETAALVVKCDRLANIAAGVGMDPSAWTAPSGSRPLSRASLLDSPLFAPQQRERPLLLPPRPNSSLEASSSRPPLAQLHAGRGSADSNRPGSRVSNRPLIATKLEDLEGEKERRLLQVIKSQGEIIKDMTARGTSSMSPLMKNPSIIKLTGSASLGGSAALSASTTLPAANPQAADSA